MNKAVVGFVTAATLAGGGVAVTDEIVNPYTDTGAKLEIVAESTLPDSGQNTVELVKERPEVRLKKWNGEVDLGVRYDTVQAEGSRVLLTDRVEWKDSAQELHAYPLDAKAGMEDGGFEIEIILNEKPNTNVFEFQIDGADQLDFFYQPPLTQDQIDVGMKRPENVVGSYAVYHSEKGRLITGDTNYATGKVFHIFRPKVFDAIGNETWAELAYKAGILSVIVPQTFLDNATYPVTVDPTFGYTTIGASQDFLSGSGFVQRSGNATNYAGADCSLDSMSFAVIAGASLSTDLTGFVSREQSVSASQHGQVRKTERTSVSITTSATWYDFTAASETIVADDYIVNIIAKSSASGGVDLMFDSSGTRNYYNDFGLNYNSIRDESPWSNSALSGGNLYSAYATCSTGGGAAPQIDYNDEYWFMMLSE